MAFQLSNLLYLLYNLQPERKLTFCLKLWVALPIDIRFWTFSFYEPYKNYRLSRGHGNVTQI